ncbi:MAG: SEC-C metal-binding domain-containing protein [Pseudomonadales bacterium]
MDLSDHDLRVHLQEQLAFLEASADAFDQGFEGEIKRLAISVRVLVHDTPRSKSLLGLLGKKNIDFADTATPFDERNKMTHSSLTLMSLGGPKGNIPFAPLDGSISRRVTDFDSWWDGIVFVDKNRTEFSRKDIVLALANKEGGAHVDPKLDAKYADLRKNNSLNWYDVSSDGGEKPFADQVPATMRQIAHEILRTLVPEYPEKKQEPEGGVIMHAAGLFEGSGPPILPTQNLRKTRSRQRKIGRNDPCPCGSGKKYKKCCLQKV